MLAVTHWRKYLLGRKFTCFVDSTVALSIMSKDRHTAKMQRWGMLMQEYLPGMQVAIKRSHENGASDALSRKFSFEKYVPQPADELELDDSLYDRLYDVDTVVRGTFGLYKPKEPKRLAEVWGVGADETASELVATLDAQSPISSMGLNYANQRDCLLKMELERTKHNQPTLHELASSPVLLAMEQDMCMHYLDSVSSVRIASNACWCS